MQMHQAGFVNIFGRPNSGKSTLLNALVGEKLSIVTSKVQTTRQRIKGIVNEPGYQIVFSDTPGIIEPRYKLHEKMMEAVKSALEDADVALLLADICDDFNANIALFRELNLRVPAILLLNKTDLVKPDEVIARTARYQSINFIKKILPVSALLKHNIDNVIKTVLEYLPQAPSYYPENGLTDRPIRFFISEIIREKIFELLAEEIPYHTAVIVSAFQEKETLTKITAEIIVTRESQKAIMLGEKGKMIKEVGSRARKDIEEFIGRKIFLELFVKVRNRWRDNNNFLKEYGYS
jgi:GTPase